MAIRRPESFRHREANLPGIKIHYVREESGPPLLLMHGWPGFWYEWYDFPAGHGGYCRAIHVD